jgi:hypothetical protein
LQGRDFRAVAWAIVKLIRQPQEHPPSLGQLLEQVGIEERARGLTPPPPPEDDPHQLWEQLNGKPAPPPMSREDALRRLRELGYHLPALGGSA